MPTLDKAAVVFTAAAAATAAVAALAAYLYDPRYVTSLTSALLFRSSPSEEEEERERKKQRRSSPKRLYIQKKRQPEQQQQQQQQQQEEPAPDAATAATAAHEQRCGLDLSTPSADTRTTTMQSCTKTPDTGASGATPTRDTAQNPPPPHAFLESDLAGPYKLNPLDPQLESAWFQPLKRPCLITRSSLRGEWSVVHTYTKTKP
jgi:hypothetical protein